ncbi:MAG: 2-oxo acid dehydrogenase subunit E2 [Actinomycetota bacterium]|nr:MAG: 2-oxo acid dehydrogenase subunit E2 [Actinomycetota bacterium]
MADITMPQLGETVTEGTVTKWLKKVGDSVAQDEIIFEVSTDKVDSEVPSSASGVLTQILVEEGETVDVGTVLAVVSSGDEAPAPAPQAAAPEPAPQAAAPEPAPQAAPGPAPAPQAAAPEPAPQAAAPEPAPQAAPGPAPAPQREVPAQETNGSLLLSPVVRKLIHDNGINPSDIVGTGAGGRITRSDVLTYLDKKASGEFQGEAQVAAAPAQPAPAQAAPIQNPEPQQGSLAPTVAPEPSRSQSPATRSVPVGSGLAGPRDETIPFTNIRRRTAEHMVRSKATSPHALVSIEVDFEAVEKVRKAVRDQFRAEEGFSLTYLPFISRATVEAMRTFPHLNASVGEDSLIVHRDLNLSIAVDLDQEGLIAPVIHGADTKRLRGLARDIRDLADRARSKHLTADDISGGTFTITNPGPFGTFMTVSIINQPQVAILSTDGVKRKPVVVTQPDGSESIAIHSVGIMALSFDHRVIDGAYAAAFLARVKEIIETWNWAQEL